MLATGQKSRVVLPSPWIVTRAPLQHRDNPARNHRRVVAVGVLARAERVEVPQADRRHPVAAREDFRVELVDVLADGVGRQQVPDAVLRHGRRGAVAVGRARRRVDEPRDTGVARGDQHVEEARRVGGVRALRIGDRPRHRPERRLVQHDVDALACAPARVRVADVGLVQRVPAPCRRADRRGHLVEVGAVSRREVVEAHHLLSQPQQRLHQMRSDEASASRDEPASRMPLYVGDGGGDRRTRGGGARH